MRIPAHSVLSNVYILTKILSALPDFSSLYRAITLSKSFYHAFQAYPQSITRPVAHQLFHSTLPSALRLVRCQLAQYPIADEDAARFEPPASPAYNEDDPANDRNWNLSREEIRALVDRRKVVQAIEDIFSSREKDRRYTTSQLTHIESTRFHRAMYRIWLFCVTYGCEAYNKGQAYAEEYDDDADLENLEHQKSFLEAFSTEELHEIITVAAFLQHMGAWAAGAGFLDDVACPSDYLTSDEQASYALFHGPQAVLRAQRNDLIWLHMDLDENLHTRIGDFLLPVITDVLDARSREPEAYPPTRKIIIDNYIGGGDTCQLCQSERVPAKNLWNVINWNYLRGFHPPSTLQRRLKGHLNYNLAESDQFIQACEKTPYTVIFTEILDLHNTNDGAKRSKDDWLCKDCLMVFTCEYLHVWFLQWKRKEDLFVPEDNCRAGYDCVIQIHDIGRARVYNSTGATRWEMMELGMVH
ncbi:hypothetical protein BJ138DRAFT_1156403 [Hygrophoropsis aurantiaca]|uniref:Uncharacterized protein n=1 Tax=Hygrophoropsis aurantiaca TaxID=72124 RepID=A0ACB8A6U2_9AGAM|nr:hypothetical protein BJ138DRAFT_1156403 [Hygrophoropsis aurantiaca]